MNTSNTFDENPKLKHKSSNTFTGIIHRTMLKLIGILPFISSTYRNHHENNLKNALLSQAARVAHDIISPIATIEMSLYTLSQEVPQDKLVIIKVALQNVRDITNSLLEKYRSIQHPDQPSSASQDQMSIQPIILLHPVIKEVISQKHCEWLDKKYK
jgi:signal transduction histidine kinase